MRPHVVATNNIASCVLEHFGENLCLRNGILPLQQVAKNQIKLNTLGKKVVKIGQKIEWGRVRHKHFWSSWGYNFLSFKGIDRKSERSLNSVFVFSEIVKVSVSVISLSFGLG